MPSGKHFGYCFGVAFLPVRLVPDNRIQEFSQKPFRVHRERENPVSRKGFRITKSYSTRRLACSAHHGQEDAPLHKYPQVRAGTQAPDFFPACAACSGNSVPLRDTALLPFTQP